MPAINPKSIIFPILLVFYEVATYLANDMYLPALPEMMHDLAWSAQAAQWTLTTWFIGAACTPLVMGAISDRFGRRPVLLIGGFIYMLSSVTCALTSTLSIFLVARFIQGGMMASTLVPGYAVIHELYEKKEAIKMLALMGSISILAPAFGPFLGSIILLFADWRWVFWVIAIWIFIFVGLLSYWMPETLPREKRHSLELNKLFRQYSRMFCNKRFILLVSGVGFMLAGFIVWITAGSLLVMVGFHYSAMGFGIIQAIIFASYILGNRRVKYWLDSMGTTLLIQLGLNIVLVGGFILFIFSVLLPHSLYAFLMGLMIFSFGSALCGAPLNRAIVESNDAPMGARMALFTSFITGFGVLGSGFASMFYNGTIHSLAFLIAIASGMAWILIWVSK